MSPFTLVYFRLATIINLIIAIDVSRLLCRALQTYKQVYNNTFYDGIVSEGFTWECSLCLNIMYANLRVQNKTLRN